jgi:apolipoprotein N-acyltransferase
MASSETRPITPPLGRSARRGPKRGSPSAPLEQSPTGLLARWARMASRPPAAFPKTVWAPALTGSLLLYAAFPPIDWWPLAWIAPIAWLLLVRAERLPGRRPYGVLWLCGSLFWLGVLQWLRLPHPATSIGWLALSFYLGCYLPIFVGLTRVAVHRLRCPLPVAAPVVWTGLELAQAHFLTGFNMAALGHSQYRWLSLIQIADVAGGYGVSCVVMFVAASLAAMAPFGGRRFTAWPLLPLIATLAAVLIYCDSRLHHSPGKRGPKIALIQGSIDTELKNDPEKQQLIYPHYYELTERAVRRHRDLDLIVWPETMYRDSLYSCSDEPGVPDSWPYSRETLEEDIMLRQQRISDQPLLLGAPVLLGIDCVHFSSQPPKRFNSALLVNRDGGIGTRYDKTHPVMFGEYVPLAGALPWLARLSPIGAGIEHGTDVPIFRVGTTRLAVNICYETTVPHVIRGHVAQLRAEGEEPDVLVNLTNDGWFWGSSELDLHLTCGVFRAVECRKPLLVAANTGFSAWVDSDGRIVARGPRRAPGYIVAQPQLDNRRSLYLLWGDVPAGLCLAACCPLAIVGLRGAVWAKLCSSHRTNR